MGNCANRLTSSANRGSNTQCLFPTARQCTTSQTVLATIGLGRFDWVSFSFTTRSCLYGIRAVFSVNSSEGNVLFNDALNTFYLRLYGVGHMVKDHSDSERGNPLPPQRLHFPISSKGSFICIIPQTG